MKPLATKTKNEIVSGVGKPRACLVSHFGSQGREPDVGCISGQWLGFVNQRQAFEDFLFVSTSSLPDLPPGPSPLSRACPFSSHLCIIPDAVFSRTCPLRRFVSTCPLPGPSLLLCATLSMFADRRTRLPLVAV